MVVYRDSGLRRKISWYPPSLSGVGHGGNWEEAGPQLVHKISYMQSAEPLGSEHTRRVDWLGSEHTRRVDWLGSERTVGWSDLPIFEIRHIAADQVYFYEFNSKNSANLSALMPIRQSFPFQKITGTLKLIFLFYLKTPSFVFKRKFPEIKNVYTFFEIGKLFLTLTKKNSKQFWVSLHF